MKPLRPGENGCWLLLVGAMIGCGQAAGVSAPIAPGPTARAVVELLAIGPGERENNQECSATGFLVNEEGIILTNAHVYEREMKCLAASSEARIVAKLAQPRSPRATAVSCQLVDLDEAHDLALLKTEGLRDPSGGSAEAFFASLEALEVAVGTPVGVTGHPLFAWDPVTQFGRVVRRARLRLSEPSAEPSEVIVLDMQLQRGTSGSPVHLEGGAVVGVVEGRNPARPTETVAVPIRYAIELLERNGLRWHRERHEPKPAESLPTAVPCESAGSALALAIFRRLANLSGGLRATTPLRDEVADCGIYERGLFMNHPVRAFWNALEG